MSAGAAVGHGRPDGPLRAAAGALRRTAGDLAQALRLVVRGAAGTDRYAAYRRHHERHHPGEPPLDPAAFWRAAHAEADRTPGARCC
ncbi:YbdD/YjiX family protein [Cellulomonas endophytica]|uniref:CstA-like transporter-associated (seleno)protein n=1 Tax=Cellulomonas endophytica TaxID=2494735 RepID=UPI0013E96939|nr:YbdD/YjiX family protein [Cellulomonas endophytica]